MEISEKTDHTMSHLLNKVPEVTFWFWIIKVLCTTVGETAADYLSVTLNFGLTGTTLFTFVALVGALIWQFKTKQYAPGIYWLAVVLISVFGTLVTDNLTDRFNVSLVTTTVIFSVVLALVFIIWQFKEHTLSIHSIRTARREAFYWLAILFTFALGTAAGDLVAEKINIGYWKSALLFAGLIAVVTIAHGLFHANAIVTFWAGYILTRPLGASLGDYMSQAKTDGGLGIGTTGTSVVFLSIIGLVVVYMVRRENTAMKQLKVA
ncbi:MAG: hypothetical protein D4R92_05460 [Actinobacteria bacterium]|nr:MAG: hypothetical protein D4R92_05460 [Actinomycetota bacterium]